MRSEGYSSRSVCLSVCLFVCLFVNYYSCTTGYEAAYERYQQLQCYKGKKKCGDFAETTAFKRYGVKTREKANMHNEHWLTSTRFSPFSAPLIIIMTQATSHAPCASNCACAEGLYFSAFRCTSTCVYSHVDVYSYINALYSHRDEHPYMYCT